MSHVANLVPLIADLAEQVYVPTHLLDALSVSIIAVGGTPVYIYYHQAVDSTGTNVQWTSSGAPNPTPSATTPPYTGSLYNICVIDVTEA